MGHVRDLPAKEMGVDVEHDFAPQYEALAGRGKVLTQLRQLARKASAVYLATDLDREGEAIAWHLAEALHLKPAQMFRVVFNEITPAAIREAFATPRQIDINKVNAQQARRILDRIVGYEVSPLLWKKVARGLSAGRVQTVAVRLIVEREREIDAFTPEEFWRIGAVFTPRMEAADRVAGAWEKFLAGRDEKGNGPTKTAQQDFLFELGAFRAELTSWRGKKFAATTADEALAAAQALGFTVARIDRREDPKAKGPARNLVAVVPQGRSPLAFSISAMKHRESVSRPPAPFTTATLQQAASITLRFTASRTMRMAQQLYEGVDIPGEGTVGLITYMRTDSTQLSRDSIEQVRGLIGEDYGQAYLPEKPNMYTARERAQEAHEAVRPTDPRRHPDRIASSLTREQRLLYELIWKRFVACQMTPARWSVTEATVAAATTEGPAEFKAMGRTLAFDGFLRVAGLPRGGDQILPDLAESKPVAPVELFPTQHFTQAPPRYTEASLVKGMEAENIGRPSTYAAIIQTIQDRQYVQLLERSFHPTDLGIVVTEKLVKHFPDTFDVRFTSQMEDRLDSVEAAQTDWVAVLRDFYGPFHERLERAAEEMVHAKAESQPSDYTCETCGKPMAYRFSKNGRYLACTGYPDCRQTYPVDKEGKKIASLIVDVNCPKCDQPMLRRQGRFGPFLSCPRYPDCNGVLNLDRKGLIKLPTPPPLVVDVPCPKCASTCHLRRGKRGPWLACSTFPKCRGRVAWATLEPARQTALEAALATHEQANPVPVVRHTNGMPVAPGTTPTLADAPAQPQPEKSPEPTDE